jgi:hypothetical protein
MKYDGLRMGLLALLLFAGGCAFTPDDWDVDELEMDGVSLEVDSQSVEEWGATDDVLFGTSGGDRPDRSTSGQRSSDQSTAGSMGLGSVEMRTNYDPTKPQPDPWDELRWRSSGSGR